MKNTAVIRTENCYGAGAEGMTEVPEQDGAENMQRGKR